MPTPVALTFGGLCHGCHTPGPGPGPGPAVAGHAHRAGRAVLSQDPEVPQVRRIARVALQRASEFVAMFGE
jgi:hypothetical protein